MKLILLGTAGVRPSLNRSGPGQVLIVGDEPLLFDCGRQVTTRLLQAGIDPIRIRHLFFTHHHFDHNSEYPYFLFVTWTMKMQKGVREKLHVYGPKGTREFHRIIAEDLYPNDIASRLTLPNRTKEGLDAEIHEVQTEGLLTDSGSWRVESVFTDHIKPHIESLAYGIEAEGRKIVIAGDNMPSQSISRLAKGVDVLVHECTMFEEEIRERGFSKWHTGPRQLGALAEEAEVKKLVLRHFSYNVADNRDKLAEMKRQVQELFHGEVIMGEDLMDVKV